MGLRGLLKQTAILAEILVVISVSSLGACLVFLLCPSILGLILIVVPLVVCVGLSVLFRIGRLPERRFFAVAEDLLLLPFAVGVSFFWVGIVCFILSKGGIRLVSSHLEFPLSSPRGITLGQNGNIYCYSCFNSRLQVYDQSGCFLRGWFVNIAPGPFHLDMTDEGWLRVSRKGGTNTYFSEHGELLREERLAVAPVQFDNRHQNEARHVDGSSLVLERPLIAPAIIRIWPDGHRQVVVRQSLGLQLVTMPLPGLLILALVGFLLDRTIRRIKTLSAEDGS